MKTLFRYILAAAALPLALLGGSCSGDSDDPTPTALRLTVDRATLEADGSDRVTFTVTSEGSDVSTAPGTVLLKTFEGRTEELGGGVNTFSCTEAGTYTFQARYEGETSNVLTVVATAPTVPARKFFTRVLGMQYTSVGCINCPSLSQGIKAYEKAHPDELVTVSLHYHMTVADPMYILINNTYAQRFNVGGYPTYILGMRPSSTSPVTVDQITTAVAQQQASYPATCGLAIATTYDDASRQAGITLKVTSNKAETYRYQIFLLEDGIEYMQYGAEEGTYVHNNVLRATMGNSIYGDRLNDGAALTPGAEVSVTRTRTLDKEWVSGNMRVAIAVLRSEDGGNTWVCDNIAACAIGASIDYKYND